MSWSLILPGMLRVPTCSYSQETFDSVVHSQVLAIIMIMYSAEQSGEKIDLNKSSLALIGNCCGVRLEDAAAIKSAHLS